MMAKVEESLVTKIVLDTYEKYGMDAALAVGGGLRVALCRWTVGDTEMYGTLARQALMDMFPDEVTPPNGEDS